MVPTDLSEIPLHVRVGQLFVVQPDPGKPHREALDDHMQNHYGGFMLRADNLKSVDETRALTRLAREYWRKLPPAMVAVDEEGGFVSDTGGITTAAPSAAALGELDDVEVTEDVYEGIGRKLRALGLNSVFAPVLDVNSEAANPVIGTRSFGSTARRVSAHGVAAVKGLRKGGVTACAKHFPGHGATTKDSHTALPKVDADRSLLTDRELAPFMEVFEKAAPEMVMTAHVIYPGLGDSKKPATLSRKVLRDLLRGELGYKGVVITDAMEMAGVADALSPDRAAVEAVLAGADLLLYAHDREMADAAYKGVLRAVEQGAISEDRLNESLERVFRMREGFRSHSWVREDDAREALTVSEESLFFSSALEALTVEGNAGVLKQIPAAEGLKMIVLPREIDAWRSVDLDLVREQLEPAGYRLMDVGPEPTDEEIALAERRASEASVVVVGTISRGPMKDPAKRLVKAVTQRDVIKVGVALLDPGDAEFMMDANCRIRTFGCGAPHLWAMCQKVMG